LSEQKKLTYFKWLYKSIQKNYSHILMWIIMLSSFTLAFFIEKPISIIFVILFISLFFYYMTHEYYKSEIGDC